jgi:hypothetical protein
MLAQRDRSRHATSMQDIATELSRRLVLPRMIAEQSQIAVLEPCVYVKNVQNNVPAEKRHANT